MSVHPTWLLELLGFSIICEDASALFCRERLRLTGLSGSLDGLPFQNEEFDFVYVSCDLLVRCWMF